MVELHISTPLNILNGIPRGLRPRKGYSVEFCENRHAAAVDSKFVHAGRNRKYITIGIGLAHR